MSAQSSLQARLWADVLDAVASWLVGATGRSNIVGGVMPRPTRRNSTPAALGWMQLRRRWRAGRLRGEFDGHVAAVARTSTPLSPPLSEAVPATVRGAPHPKDSERLADARNSLGRLLDGHAATRKVWPSLALVERALCKYGWAGIERMSPKVLHDAAMVLDRLTVDGCESGVVVLCERMMTTLGIEPDREFIAGRRRQAERSAETQVREASLTEFMEVDREWDLQLVAAEPIARGPR